MPKVWFTNSPTSINANRLNKLREELEDEIAAGGGGGTGTGDMLKSVYDTNNNGKVDTADAIAWGSVTGKPATFPPGAHAPTHLDNGADAIPVVTATRTGLVPKLSGSSANYLDGTGVFSTPPVNTGPPGAAGSPGLNAWTNTSASFTVPAYGGSVTISVADTSWVALGEWVYIDDAAGTGTAGQLVVTAKTSTTLTLFNPTGSAIPLVTATVAGLVPAPASAPIQSFVTDSGGNPAWHKSYFVDVTLFGADSTGASDSTTAIRNAISSLPASGGTIYFPAGTFKVSGTITLSVPGNYVGAGSRSSIITTASATGDVFHVTASSVTIANLQFTSSVTRTSSSYINGDAGISNLTIANFLMLNGFYGIYAPFIGTIINGYIGVPSGGTGIMLDKQCTVLVDNVIFQGPGRTVSSTAILILGTQGLFITHSQLFNCLYALHLASGTTNNIVDSVNVDNSFIDTCGYGVVIEATASGAVVTNTQLCNLWIASSNNHGVYCATSGGGQIARVLYHGGKINGNGVHGIYVADVSVTDVQIRDAVISYNGTVSQGHGIYLGPSVSQFSIQGCRIGSSLSWPGNTGYGINFGGSNTNCIITGNDLRGNTLGEQGGAPTGTFVNTNNI